MDEQLDLHYSLVETPPVVTDPTEIADLTEVMERAKIWEQFAVEVVRSPKRRKTAQARLVANRLEIRIPARSSKAEETEFIDYFTDKFQRKRDSSTLDLAVRATKLAGAYDLRTPESIRWVSNQKSRWGSCTPSEGSIRLSDRLVRFPEWVIDYVIVHELAHLDVASHGPVFWAIVNRYPRTERARGFLIAQAWLEEDGS